MTSYGSLADRFRELTYLWHLWKASILEEMGELPPGLEGAVETTLLGHLDETSDRLEEALRICKASAESLRASAAGALHDPSNSKPEE
jgi:hypothetical protein